MKKPILIALVTCALAAGAFGACSSKAPAPANPDKLPDGVWETNTDETMRLPIKAAPPDHVLKATRSADKKRTLTHFDGKTEAKIGFLPDGYLLVAGGVYGEGRTMICGVVGPQIDVATSDYRGASARCAVRDASGFAEPVTSGKWVMDTCFDAEGGGRFTVLYTNQENPLFVVKDVAAPCQSVTWDGKSWSAPAPDQCKCLMRAGKPCKDPCFKDIGAWNKSGSCVLPENAAPECPSDQSCTGDPKALCEPQQVLMNK